MELCPSPIRSTVREYKADEVRGITVAIIPNECRVFHQCEWISRLTAIHQEPVAS
jgi:hypothetical protein